MVLLAESGSEKTAGVTKLHLVTCMEDMQVKLCNHELEFADVIIRGLFFYKFVSQFKTVILLVAVVLLVN